jgi:predicted MPP superfamily phosphohydrolase
MKRLAWLTDIHLNFVPPAEQERLWDEVLAARPDAVLLSGDVAEARDVAEYLRAMRDRLAVPILFVLGNHDFYGASIAEVRQRMAALVAEAPGLVYLTQSGPVEVAASVAVVGHDGWADARLGDWEHSDVVLNDYFLIRELAGLGRKRLRVRLEALADEAAAHARRVLPAALARAEEVYFVTHVPPYREAAWYQGRHSDDNWAPHFTSRAMGEALREIMAAHPQRRLTVLCGHTHGQGEAEILPNLRVLTGGAMYGQPEVQRVFEVVER